MRDFSKLKLGVVLVLFFIMLLICMLPYWTDLCNGEGGCMAIFNKRNDTLSAVHRKLLRHSLLAIEKPNRVWGEMCTSGDISINQGRSAPLPSGVPAFTVEIMNACVTGCNISRIHLNCGRFSSVRFINPKIFKRLRYNDCLVNDGKPLLNGGTLTFDYANTFPYPLSVSSIVCS
ncbi:TPD1 protein homolog 1-like [Euphorbia lathyris]|uniref:TPD1 protein homolog 1-like n=1 Tax=Euphorbia lathyris TaxID=212925 RepID=UPI0033141F30